MYEEPDDHDEESPAERAATPADRAKDKTDEFRMHAELAAVFEGNRKFDAQILTKLDPDVARDVQRTIAKLEKARVADSPLLPPESMQDAARILGANRLVAFKDVTVPLFGAGLVSAWLLVFLPSLRELSSSILLFTTRSRVVSVVIYTLYEEGLWEAVSALGILLLGLTLVLVAVAQRFLGRRFVQI